MARITVSSLDDRGVRIERGNDMLTLTFDEAVNLLKALYPLLIAPMPAPILPQYSHEVDAYVPTST